MSALRRAVLRWLRSGAEEETKLATANTYGHSPAPGRMNIEVIEASNGLVFSMLWYDEQRNRSHSAVRLCPDGDSPAEAFSALLAEFKLLR